MRGLNERNLRQEGCAPNLIADCSLGVSSISDEAVTIRKEGSIMRGVLRLTTFIGALLWSISAHATITGEYSGIFINPISTDASSVSTGAGTNSITWGIPAQGTSIASSQDTVSSVPAYGLQVFWPFSRGDGRIGKGPAQRVHDGVFRTPGPSRG